SSKRNSNPACRAMFSMNSRSSSSSNNLCGPACRTCIHRYSSSRWKKGWLIGHRQRAQPQDSRFDLGLAKELALNHPPLRRIALVRWEKCFEITLKVSCESPPETIPRLGSSQTVRQVVRRFRRKYI